MLEGIRLLGLDTRDLSLATVFNQVGKDASSRIDFKDFEEMVMTVMATQVCVCARARVRVRV